MHWRQTGVFGSVRRDPDVLVCCMQVGITVSCTKHENLYGNKRARYLSELKLSHNVIGRFAILHIGDKICYWLDNKHFRTHFYEEVYFFLP